MIKWNQLAVWGNSTLSGARINAKAFIQVVVNSLEQSVHQTLIFK